MNLRNFSKNKKRATLFVALFILGSINSISPGVASASNSREGYRDIIAKAQNLSLQKDRSQAINLLKLALKKEPKKGIAQKELTQALINLTSMFFSEKAQQLYELGLSLRVSDPILAQTKLLESQKAEVDNLAIEIAIFRLSISQNECAGVVEKATKNKELMPYLEELRLVYAQALICVGKFDEYSLLKTANDPKQLTLEEFWNIAELEYLYRSGQGKKALDQSSSLEKEIPEIYYWRWRAEVDQKLKPEKSAQKYINLCKTLNSRRARELIYEPNLCRRTTEVETFLKKNNNSET